LDIFFTEDALENESDLRIAMFVGALLFTYFNIVSYAIMGYVIYQRQGELGYTSNEDEDDEPTDQKLLRLAEVDILMREGRYDDARSHLLGIVNDYSLDSVVLERYHAFLIATKDKERLAKSTEQLVTQLLKNRRNDAAANAYLATVLQVPDFRIQGAECRFRLAKALYAKGQFKPVLAVLQNLHKDAPGFAAIPEAYFMAAKCFSEGMNDDVRALKMLDFVIAHYSNHALIAEVHDYKAVLEKVVAV